VELLSRTSRPVLQFAPQRSIDPVAVATHRPHDLGHLGCVRIQESLDQTGCLGRLLILDDLAMDGGPGKNCPSQEN
jgi:hypothetical protein